MTSRCGALLLGNDEFYAVPTRSARSDPMTEVTPFVIGTTTEGRRPPDFAPVVYREGLRRWRPQLLTVQ